MLQPSNRLLVSKTESLVVMFTDRQASIALLIQASCPMIFENCVFVGGNNKHFDPDQRKGTGVLLCLFLISLSMLTYF